ncbi:MAG: urease accessory UreF family protein [Fibrobacteria bacterium]
MIAPAIPLPSLDGAQSLPGRPLSPLSPLQLMQLADACFPSGGFAFSNGLESLAKLGYIKRMEDFREYLDCHLDQLTAAELPYLNSAYAAAGFPFASVEPDALEGGDFQNLVREWDAWLFMPSQRRGSLSQGQAWSRAMEETYDMPAIRAIRPWFARRNLPLHYLMVFAATLRAGGLPLRDGQSLLIHMALRDQLGAAVRLGLLGSLQAQKMHHAFIAGAEKHRESREAWTYTRAVRMAQMIEMGQASHPHLYSKLFQN